MENVQSFSLVSVLAGPTELTHKERARETKQKERISKFVAMMKIEFYEV